TPRPSARRLDHEIKRRSPAPGPLGPDPAPVAIDDPPRSCQPNPGPWKLTLAVQPLEGAEETVGGDHVEADPVVHDEDACLNIDYLRADHHLWRRLRAAELPSVVEQVGEQDAHEPFVPRSP